MMGKALPADMIVRPYLVTVRGFANYIEYTTSRGRALRRSWESYQSHIAEISFGEFLRIANAIIYYHDRFGELITVCGAPAYLTSWNTQYIQFVRPNSDVVLNAHPLDVDPPSARLGTPYFSAGATA